MDVAILLRLSWLHSGCLQRCWIHRLPTWITYIVDYYGLITYGLIDLVTTLICYC